MKFTLFVFVLCLYSVSLTAQEITAFQGNWGDEFYQDKQKLSWKEVNTIMMESAAAEMNWQKYKKQSLGGLIAGTANLGATIWFIVEYEDDRVVTAPAIAWAGTAIISSIFFNGAKKNKKKAILEYNDALGAKTSYRLVPTSNEHGVGLALKF